MRGLIDSWLWEAEPAKAQRILNAYLRGSLSYVDFKIKLFYLRKQVQNAKQVQLKLDA